MQDLNKDRYDRGSRKEDRSKTKRKVKKVHVDDVPAILEEDIFMFMHRTFMKRFISVYFIILSDIDKRFSVGT